jgi:predicted nucleotide-binding protein
VKIAVVGSYKSPSASQVPILRTTLQKDWSAPVRDALGRWLDDLRKGPVIVIVHGHDDAARDSLVGVLEELGVDRALIMGLEQLPGETLPEKWETVAAQAEGAIVLATPDDEGRVRGETTLRARARENVWLELGWLWGRLLDRRRLLLLIRDADDEAIEIPSDYSGVVFEKFKEDPGDSRKAIAALIDQLRRHLAE